MKTKNVVNSPVKTGKIISFANEVKVEKAGLLKQFAGSLLTYGLVVSIWKLLVYTAISKHE